MLSTSLRNFFPHCSCLLELVSLLHLTSDLPRQKVEVVEVEFVSLEGALVNLLLIMATVLSFPSLELHNKSAPSQIFKSK